MILARFVAGTVLAVTACGADPPDPEPLPPPPPIQRPKLSTTTLVVRVTDGDRPAGARVLLIDSKGQPLRMGSIDVYGARQGSAACPIATGVVGSWDGLILGYGLAEVPIGVDTCVPSPAIPYGTYKVVAWRGVEFERWEGTVDLSPGRGRVELAIPLERAWAPAGTLAADLHVHARASADSTVPNPQRVVAQVAAGIQVIALSDHNVHGDLDAEIAELGLEGVVASIASTELTVDLMHVGIFPVVVDPTKPNGGALPEDKLASTATKIVLAKEVKRLLNLARTVNGPGPGKPIVQLNHPRLRSASLYDVTQWDGERWPPPFPINFDAVEVLAGYSAFNVGDDRRFDQSVRDFYTMFDHGHLITPLGNSDTHDLNWVLDGTTRNYVYVDDDRTRPFDEPQFIQAIRDRRVVATSGPWLDVHASADEAGAVQAGPGQGLRATGKVWLDVTIAQARFVKTDRIRVTVGGPRGPRLAQTIDVPPNVRTYHWADWVAVGSVDTWIGVTADGDTPLPIEQTGSYQKDKWQRPGVTPYALASPILVDANRDGVWRRGIARKKL